jgi:hypothetical protein
VLRLALSPPQYFHAASCVHQHRGVDENAPPKKPHRERSDKGQPKMSPDGTFKSQKMREAAAAAA